MAGLGHDAASRSYPHSEIEHGVDPTNDWRAPYIHWPPQRLLACAHDWEGLYEIFMALCDGDLDAEEARQAYRDHLRERMVKS